MRRTRRGQEKGKNKGQRGQEDLGRTIRGQAEQEEDMRA
jgi:hypothetical protein